MPVAAPVLTAPHPSTFVSSHVCPALTRLFSSGRVFFDEISFKTLGKPDQLANLTSKAWYAAWLKSTDPLVASITLAWWVSVACWVLGEVTGNLSQVGICPLQYSLGLD